MIIYKKCDVHGTIGANLLRTGNILPLFILRASPIIISISLVPILDLGKKKLKQCSKEPYQLTQSFCTKTLASRAEICARVFKVPTCLLSGTTLSSRSALASAVVFLVWIYSSTCSSMGVVSAAVATSVSLWLPFLILAAYVSISL